MGSEYTKASDTTAAPSDAASAVTNSAPNKGLASGAEATLALSARDEFVIDCLRNARYHEDRERFFATIHKTAMFVAVASGTATFAWLKAAPYFAGLITLSGLLDLVFDVSGKARLHASLRRRVYDLLAQAEDPSRTIESLREQAARIYADEPPCMHAANLIAFNGAMAFMHRPHEHLYKISPHQRFFRHVRSFASTKFQTYGELAKQEAGGAS